MKKMTKKARQILTFLAAFCMIFAMTLPVMAEENAKGVMTAAEDPRESVMLMTLGYEPDGGNYQYYQWGSCFLINDEYVLTNKHVVTMTNAEFTDFQAWCTEKFGVQNVERTDKHIKLYLYVNRDMKVLATMHDSVNSDNMDFAAVKLSEKIYDRKPIALGDSDSVETQESVHALGFPWDSEGTKDFNTKDDVSIVDGSVSKITEKDSVDVIEHTAPLNFGNSGGPLLDENNNVIGVNRYMEGKRGYSVQINYIKHALDTFGIPYVDAAETSSVDEPVQEDTTETSGEVTEPEKPDNTVYLADLQSVLDEAKSIDTEGYTDETVSALDDSIGSAEAVLKNSEAEIAEIQGATDDLNEAIAGLEEKTGPNMMMIVIIAAIVIIVVIIIIIVITSGKKKKAAPAPTSVPTLDPPPAPTPTPVQRQAAAPIPEGAGETTLLDAGAGETTLLSNAGSAYLIRKKNGEKVAINLQNFKIGKERRKVNYCISDNTSVSRVHCEIVKRGADYYAVDQGATNFTFVNGVQLSPHQETLLSDQSVLKLSDEEFEFHLS